MSDCKISCGNGWGLGANIHDDGSVSYGFPESDDPNKFEPDYEVCTEDEIKAWKKAKSKRGSE